MKQLSFLAVTLLFISSAALAVEPPDNTTSSEPMAQTPQNSAEESAVQTSESSPVDTTASEQKTVQYTEENIPRTAFTHAVENREPVDKVGQLTNDNEKIYFFTEIKGMAGKTITHRWEHAGNVKAEVKFKVGSDRWRVWSSKNLQPGWVGEWIVSVIDENGNTLTEESMAYVPAEKAAPAEQGDKMMNDSSEPVKTESPDTTMMN